MPKQPCVALTAILLVFSAVIAWTAEGAPRYAIIARIPGPSTVAGWDYATIDARARRLFLATMKVSGGGVTVLDLSSKRVIPDLIADGMPHGIAILDRGTAAAADAATNAVLLFNEKSGRLLASVPTGKPPQKEGWHNPDSLLLEPRTGLLVAVNGDSGALALVDVSRRTEVGTIVIDGKLEAPAASGDGTVYVNVSSNASIAVVDLHRRKTVRELPLKECEEPTGLEYDASDRILISVCSNGLAKFVDPNSGSELASIPVGRGADGVMYDSSRKIVFIAAGDDATLSIIRIRNRHDIRSLQTLATQPGTRLGAVDPATGRVYLPTSKPDLTAPPLHLPGLPPIPPAASGSFQFLVIDRRG